MGMLSARRCALFLLASAMLWGCEANYGNLPRSAQRAAAGTQAQEQSYGKGNPESDKPLDTGLKVRPVAEKELLEARDKDPELGIVKCWEILARLNVKDTLYISGDIRNGHPLNVPNDFRAYKNWTPLPKHIAALKQTPKFILIVRGIPFMGWYEHGDLVKDTIISVGKELDWTALGTYKIQEKYVDHVSRSYSNDFGQPAWMPYSMRIYDTVYIHGGDVAGGYYSRGCIYVPFLTAEELFNWADSGTPVLIIHSLSNLDQALKNDSKPSTAAEHSNKVKGAKRL